MEKRYKTSITNVRSLRGEHWNFSHLLRRVKFGYRIKKNSTTRKFDVSKLEEQTMVACLALLHNYVDLNIEKARTKL